MAEDSVNSAIRRLNAGARISDAASQLPINRADQSSEDIQPNEAQADPAQELGVDQESVAASASRPVAESVRDQSASAEVPVLGEEEVSQLSDGNTVERMPASMVDPRNRATGAASNQAGPSNQGVQPHQATANVGIPSAANAIAQWQAEQAGVMTDVPSALPQSANPYAAPSVTRSEPEGESEEDRRLRLIGPNPTRCEIDAYNRGLYNRDHWLTRGIPTWSELPGDPHADKNIGSQFDERETRTYDYERHLRISPRDILNHGFRRYVAYSHEHVKRVRYSGVSLQEAGLTVFDVNWARRASDVPYLGWLASDAFSQLKAVIDKAPPSALPLVSRAVFGPYRTLCESDGVPWESYLLELPADRVSSDALRNPAFRRLAPTVVHYSSRDGNDELVIRPSLQDSEGDYLGYAVIQTKIEEQLPVYTPASWRRQERSKRHRFKRWIAGFQCAVAIQHRRVVEERFPPLPYDWNGFEVPYGFWNEVPRCIYYWGSRYMRYEISPIMAILLRTDWCVSVATHLLYEARGGRLWWIPMEVRKGIRELGLDDSSKVPTTDLPEGFDREREVKLADQLRQLLEYIDSLAWSKIPRDGLIPEYPFLSEDFEACGGMDPDSHIGRITPVFRGADWVIFDSELWQLHLPEKYFVPFNDASRTAFTPEDPRPDRVYDGEGRGGYDGGFAGAVDDWRQRQIARSGSDAASDVPSSSVPHEHPAPTPGVRTRIQRQRRTTSNLDANQLLSQLADRGILSMEELVSRLDGSSSGAGPSNPNQNNTNRSSE